MGAPCNKALKEGHISSLDKRVFQPGHMSMIQAIATGNEYDWPICSTAWKPRSKARTHHNHPQKQ
jgi:hypothetical protein